MTFRRSMRLISSGGFEIINIVLGAMQKMSLNYYMCCEILKYSQVHKSFVI
jgi:hypothetical protein